MNRDTKRPVDLIALARARRIQRARVHADLHRDAPPPTLRGSLGSMIPTARGADDAAEVGHRMTVLGVARGEEVAYVAEDVGEDAPVVYRLYLRGPRHGHLVPMHAWYDHADDASELRARIAELTPRLEPVRPTAPEAWMLSTRIVQRRALRLSGPGGCAGPPIRKFALQLAVEPVSGIGPSGRSTATAFLSPRAQLTGVWSLAPRGGACDAAIARVTFTGVPSGTGLTRDTVVLLAAGWPEPGGGDPHVGSGCQPA